MKNYKLIWLGIFCCLQPLILFAKDGNLTEHIVPTLEEALLAGKGQIMFNLDKAYSVFDEVYAVLEKTGTASLVIMKGGQPVETVKSEFGDYLDKVIYIPVIGLDGKDGEKKVRDYMTQLHPAAFELVYSDSSSPLPRKVKSIILGKSRIWYNTLWASLAGGHEDDQALKDPDGNYGYLIEELGARILQTDRPGFMLDYLRKKGLHD